MKTFKTIKKFKYHGKIILLYSVISVVLLIVIFPILWTFLTSIKSKLDIYCLPPKLIFKPVATHWSDMMLVRNVGSYFLNSSIVALTNMLLSVTIGTLAAYSLRELKSLKLRNNVLTWALSNRVVPPIVALIPFYILSSKLGILDTHLILIVIYLSFNLPFSLWMMLGYLDAVPIELEESALLDGCSRLKVLWNIILPLVRPGLIATSLFVFIFAWNEFLFASILTMSRASTLPKMATSFVTSRGIVWGSMCTIAILQFLPIITVSLVVQRHIVKGLTMGALRE